MKNNQIEVQLSTDIKKDRAKPIGIKLMSRDINNNQFVLRFKSNGEPLSLSDGYTVEVLSHFVKAKTETLTTATVYDDYAKWVFDTSFITQDDTVYNYVYVKKDGVPIASADANAFYFEVGLSKIDEGSRDVAEYYDSNYEQVLHEFEVAINLTKEEWAQMADETRDFVEEIKDKTVDEFVELKMGEELANLEVNYATRLTGLEQKDNDLTAQLAQKVGINQNESVTFQMLAPDIKQAINDGDWEIGVNTSEIYDGAVTREKLSFHAVSGNIGKNKYDKNSPSIEKGVFVNKTNGIIYANVNYEVYTMKVIGGQSVVINWCDQTAFYDSEGAYISGAGEIWSRGPMVIPIPSTATTLKTSVRTEKRDDFQIEYGAQYTPYEPYRVIIDNTSLPDHLQDITTPNPPTVTSARKKPIELANGIASGTIKKIKLIGDSITNGVGGTGYDTAGEVTLPTKYVNVNGYCWANELKKYLEEKYPTVQVTNYGVSGSTSRLIRANRTALIKEDDDLVIVMLGTNDRQLNLLTETHTNLVTIGDYVRAFGNNVIFMSSVPASISNETGFAIHMEDINNAVRFVSEHFNQDFISIYTEFMRYCDVKGVTIDSLLADGLHPNDDGYTVMFHIVLSALGFGAKRPGATW